MFTKDCDDTAKNARETKFHTRKMQPNKFLHIFGNELNMQSK